MWLLIETGWKHSFSLTNWDQQQDLNFQAGLHSPGIMLRVSFTVIITHSSPHPHKELCHNIRSFQWREEWLCVSLAATFKSFELFLNHSFFFSSWLCVYSLHVQEIKHFQEVQMMFVVKDMSTKKCHLIQKSSYNIGCYFPMQQSSVLIATLWIWSVWSWK